MMESPSNKSMSASPDAKVSFAQPAPTTEASKMQITLEKGLKARTDKFRETLTKFGAAAPVEAPVEVVGA